MEVVVGSKVPDFTAESTGGTVRLSGLAGRKVVLYFYPKDNTPGCAQEGSELRDRFDAFTAAGAVILGVSRDSLKSHAGFRERYGFPFHLISDPDESLCRQFDVLKLKQMYGRQVHGIERSTFVIGADGTLVREWRGIKVPDHVEEVLKFVQSV